MRIDYKKKEVVLTEQDINRCHKTRTKLAEWSQTPEGKAKYEEVANEMRKLIY